MFRKASHLLKGDGVRYANSILVKHFAGKLQLVELSLSYPTDCQVIGFPLEKAKGGRVGKLSYILTRKN